MSDPLLQVDDLQVRFRTPRGPVTAVNGVSFSLRGGDVLGIIGESGSGKSVTMQAILRILPEKRSTVTGSIRLEGTDVLSLSAKALSRYRGSDVSMIFQEPALSLDPVFTIGHQIAETVQRHTGCDRQAARSRALEMLERVKIPSARSRMDTYPHEMSGGMRQRAMIALALSCSPKLLLADEPTTALDATVQIQIILLLRELQRELGMAAMFVTHDVGVAAEVSDQIAVMYAGRIVEYGSATQVLKTPLHPYTQGLLASTVYGGLGKARVYAIPGMPPDLQNLPKGCSFAPRCNAVTEACHRAPPPLTPMPGDRRVACIHAGVVPQ
ncbi:ABC transporter ATP-binding protein [Devosia sp.]|uniref:ABC transporter ATP-binding protein n=1 Tax=Devosia sp. TaxID=1871048 RepID=UPI003A8CDAB8